MTIRYGFCVSILSAVIACSSESTLREESSPGEGGSNTESTTEYNMGSGGGAATYETQTATVASTDDVTLSILYKGGYEGGPVLIAINGGPGVSHHSVMPLLEYASDDLRVVTYDQRGMGNSTAPSNNDYSLQAYAEDVESIRNYLGVEKVHIAGHSFGGLISMAYVEDYKDYIASVTFIDSAPPAYTQLALASMRLSSRIAELQEEGIIPSELPDPEEDCKAYTLAILPAYFADPYFPIPQELMDSTCSGEVQTTTFDQIVGYKYKDVVNEINVPSMVIYGAEDGFGLEMRDDVVNAFSATNPQVETLEDCGHTAYLECPDAFDAVFAPFVETTLH